MASERAGEPALTTNVEACIVGCIEGATCAAHAECGQEAADDRQRQRRHQLYLATEQLHDADGNGACADECDAQP